MNEIMPKKLLPLCILRILEKNTDSDHRMLQKDLQSRLQEEYGIRCDRKTVQQNILYLKEFGYEIDYEEGYYLSEREFSADEIHLMIDSILFSQSISQEQTKELRNKIKKLGSSYFTERLENINCIKSFSKRTDRYFCTTIDIIAEAIKKGKKISFYYNQFGMDMMMHPIRPNKYDVNPYQIVACNSHYYLVCNEEKQDSITTFRVDRITNVDILNEKLTSMSEVEGAAGWSMTTHITEPLHKLSDRSVSIEFKADKRIFSDIFDWFGKDFAIIEEQGDMVVIRTKCSEEKMFYWTVQYADYVEILAPKEEREKLCSIGRLLVKKYDC